MNTLHVLHKDSFILFHEKNGDFLIYYLFHFQIIRNYRNWLFIVAEGGGGDIFKNDIMRPICGTG